MCPDSQRPRGASGFSIVTAVFLLVVLALLGAFIVSVTGLQQSGHQLDILGARAYQSSRAGIDWMAYRVLDPENALGSALAPCPALAAPPNLAGGLAGSLAAFTVTLTCTRTTTTEGARNVAVYEVTATACNQPDAGTGACPNAAPGAGYVDRQLRAIFSKCKDPAGAAPRFACG
ncbi:MAG: agglutinin biogenesis protein MshP [Burkholderiales bacterium]|nr:agglutinin biogenesis protein MshP [Burkholderiales bacterium]